MDTRLVAFGLATMASWVGFTVPCPAAEAASCDAPVAIQFEPKAASAVRTGGIARGDLSCWTVVAGRGQVMTVKLQSTGDNVVMQAYAPGWKVSKDDGDYRFAGAALQGAAEGEDAPGWSGVLPAAGKYLIVLGTKSGGGDFKMTVLVGPKH